MHTDIYIYFHVYLYYVTISIYLIFLHVSRTMN